MVVLLLRGTLGVAAIVNLAGCCRADTNMTWRDRNVDNGYELDVKYVRGW